MRSLKAANGSRTGVSSYPLPTAAGVHLSMMIPFGTVKNERRVAVLEAVSAGEPKAGSIASSSGNARAVPAPRKKVRLGIDFLKIIILFIVAPYRAYIRSAHFIYRCALSGLHSLRSC